VVMFTLGIGRVACAAMFDAIGSYGRMAPRGPANPLGVLDVVNLNVLI
jgi:hypothetical protein